MVLAKPTVKSETIMKNQIEKITPLSLWANTFSLLTKLILPMLVLLFPTAVYAAANLQPNDFVGISFWLISMALMASTVFFLWETQGVTAKWKTSR